MSWSLFRSLLPFSTTSIVTDGTDGECRGLGSGTRCHVKVRRQADWRLDGRPAKSADLCAYDIQLLRLCVLLTNPPGWSVFSHRDRICHSILRATATRHGWSYRGDGAGHLTPGCLFYSELGLYQLFYADPGRSSTFHPGLAGHQSEHLVDAQSDHEPRRLTVRYHGTAVAPRVPHPHKLVRT